MRAIHQKIGRNDSCPCGSGIKYKKCCISNQESLSEFAHQAGLARLRQRIYKNLRNNVKMIEGKAEVKMSEVILHLAEELLEGATTKLHKDSAIMITCMIWNITVIDNPEEQEVALSNILNAYDDEDDKLFMLEVINSIKEKKKKYYSKIDRIIVDHELSGNGDNYQLKIAATVKEEALL